jgi:hypothetical protein
MQPDKAEFKTFWRGHSLSVALANAALAFLRDEFDYDGFAQVVRFIHQEHCDPLPDLPRPPRPALRLVTGD